MVVVEDDPGLRGLETRELERAGFAVRVAENSTVALERASEKEPDCWLIDHGLSGEMTGLELATALRQSGHDAPVVLIAGRDDPEVLLQAMRGGVRDFVLKGPGFSELLVARVQATIESMRTEQVLRRAQAKAAAEEVKRRALEGEVAERRKTEAIARSAIERLEEVDRRKDEFLAMLGHELRNPLAPISNAVEILRVRGGSSSEVQWAVEVVGRQLGQLRRLVDDLLDVARITYGRFQLAFAPLLLKDVVLHAIERCRPAIESKGHSLTVTHLHEQLSVYGDATRLEQAVVNLLDNAVKYTPAHGTIVVSAVSQEGEAVIVVADNGVGIRAEELSSIFQLFVQGDRDLARSQGGLGVGLSLVRRVAELHGGRVEAASDGIGNGATFTLRLPLSQLAPPATAPERRTPMAMPGRRVVVVDDNADAAESMAMLLRLWGFAVDCVADGERAISLIQANKPDAVLLDLGLPGMDGLRVAERLRAAPDAGGFVLIAVTGYGQQRDRERTRRAGFDRHLVKPVAASALQETLAHLLQP